MAVDFGLIVAVSTAICLASHHLVLMTVVVPSLIVVRTVAVIALDDRPGAGRRELLFLALCTALGAFNDWNSVCRHAIYRYTVPHFFAFSSIPIWMLLYWGMILRFFARFARWEALGPPLGPENRIGVGKLVVDHPVFRIAAQLALVVATRQTIYRFPLDPIWSWLPFLLALATYLVFFFPSRHDLKLLCVFLVGGPLIEILYIRVGALHAYDLGWLWGVPLWIVLWWLLIIPIWKDLSLRVQLALRVT
jgi:hypothetical protein